MATSTMDIQKTAYTLEQMLLAAEYGWVLSFKPTNNTDKTK